MAVLKVARQLNLVRDLDRVTLPGHEPVMVPEALLQRAIEHGSEPLLVDAMALVCSHPKSTAVPGIAQHDVILSAPSYLADPARDFLTCVASIYMNLPSQP